MAVLTKHQFASKVTPDQAAEVAVARLERDSVLANAVWINPGSASGRLGVEDQVNIMLPGLLKPRERELRSRENITFDYLGMDKTSVKLEKHLYSAVQVTDAELTLDVANFSVEVLAPVVAAIGMGIETLIADKITKAQYDFTVTSTVATMLKGIVQAKVILDRAMVPQTDRMIVVGTGIEAEMLTLPNLVQYDMAGDANALRHGKVGTLFGMPVISSPLVPANEAYMLHKTAFPVVMRVPIMRPALGPEWGIGEGAAAVGANHAMRLIHDRHTMQLSDVIVGDVFIGGGVTKDMGKIETVKSLPTFTPWTTDKDPETDGLKKFIRAVKLTVTDALGA